MIEEQEYNTQNTIDGQIKIIEISVKGTGELVTHEQLTRLFLQGKLTDNTGMYLYQNTIGGKGIVSLSTLEESYKKQKEAEDEYVDRLWKGENPGKTVYTISGDAPYKVILEGPAIVGKIEIQQIKRNKDARAPYRKRKR